jgi:hypothetical protein
MDKFAQIKQLNMNLKDLWLDYWLSENLFTLQWWIIMGIFVKWFVHTLEKMELVHR